MPRVPLHKRFTSLSFKSCKNTSCTYFKYNDPIKSQFCTGHDSWAVMACAKLWHDWIIRVEIRKKKLRRYKLINFLWNVSQFLLILTEDSVGGRQQYNNMRSAWQRRFEETLAFRFYLDVSIPRHWGRGRSRSSQSHVELLTLRSPGWDFNKMGNILWPTCSKGILNEIGYSL